MNKRLHFYIFIAFMVILSACGGSDSNSNVVATLDRSAWPAASSDAEASANSAPTAFPTVNPERTEALKQKAEAQKSGERSGLARLAETNDADSEQLPTPTPTPTVAASASESNSNSVISELAEDEAVIDTSIIDTGAIATGALNVRTGPGVDFDVMTQLDQGAFVSILVQDEDSEWINVRTSNGIRGWVNGRYVTRGNGEIFGGSAIPASTISQPAVGASGGRLLVQSTSGGEIYIINRDGSGLRLLTGGIDPALSPDGSQIAFTRWGGDDVGSLWVANTDGSGETRIVGGLRQIKSPSWSPDSSQIAFNFQEGGTMDAERKCQPLSEGEPDINFFVAYDVELVYEDFGDGPVPTKLCWRLPPDPHWQLRVFNLQAKTFEDLPAGQYAFAPTWDPANRQRVVSAGSQGLVQTDVAAGTAAPLTNDLADRGPVFSSNGRHIAVTYKQHDHWDIHRLNADGSVRVRLTKTPLYAIVDSPNQWNNASPTFSPDGSEIAFLTDRQGHWEVWIMNLDGSDQRPLFSEDVNAQLNIRYDGNDARMLGWGE